MQQFEVSRITVRRAIANLVQQGLVEAQRGRGVFVKAQHKVTRSLSNPLIFFDEAMKRQGSSASIRSLSFNLVPPPNLVVEQLALAATEQVYCQKKLILTDGVPVAFDITYIRFDIGQTFAQELQSSLIYPTLDRNGVSIEQVQVTLECTHATPDISEALEIPLGAPLLANRYTALTLQKRPIICGETLSRGDRLNYSVILTKANGNPGCLP